MSIIDLTGPNEILDIIPKPVPYPVFFISVDSNTTYPIVQVYTKMSFSTPLFSSLRHPAH